MELVQERCGDVVVVELEGTVEFRNQQEVREAVTRAIPGGEKVNLLLDMSGVELVDSAGLSVFISLGREIQGRGGHFKFCSMQPPIRKIFEIARLNLTYETFPTRQSALESF